MAVLVSDTFTDTDAVSLDAHVPNTRPGSNMWVESLTNWTITSNQARTNTGYRGHATIDCGESDCEVSADGATYWDDSGGLFGVGLVVRWTDADNHWRVNINHTDDLVYIVQRTANVDTVRASGAVTIVEGTVYNIKAVLDGQTITAYIDDTSITSYTSAAQGETATKHGIYICRTSNDGSYVDNFLAETAATGGAVATLAVTLAGATIAAAATAEARAALAVTLASATLEAAGAAPVSGSLAATLAGASITAAAAALAQAAAAATLEGATLQAAAAALAQAQLASTLEGAALTSTGTAPAKAQVAATLAGVSISAAAVAPASGSLAATLAGASLAAAGAALARASVAATLAGATLTATAEGPFTTWTIPLATTLINGFASPYNAVQAGDILEFEPGTRGAVTIQNLPDSAVNPITIRNGDGVVTFSNASASPMIYLRNMHHFRLTGTGHGQEYGIRIAECGPLGILGKNKTDNCEIDHIRFDNLHIGTDTSICVHILNEVEASPSYDYDGDGSNDAAVTAANYTCENIYVHDCLVDGGYGVYTTGMFCYLGFSNRLEQPTLSIAMHNVEVANNIIRNMRHKSIQCGSVTEGLYIHDNTLTRCAMSASQKTAIIVNHGAGGRVCRNWIQDTPGNGITCHSDGILIDDNLIIRCGDGSSYGYGIVCSSHDYSTALTGAVSVINNTIISPNNYGFATNSTITGQVHVHNNIIVNPVTGYYSVPGGANYTFSNNFTNALISAAGFVNAAGDNYNLAMGSACIDAGADVSAYGITTDGNGNTRPLGEAYDQGCYEYVSGGSLAVLAATLAGATLSATAAALAQAQLAAVLGGASLTGAGGALAQAQLVAALAGAVLQAAAIVRVGGVPVGVPARVSVSDAAVTVITIGAAAATVLVVGDAAVTNLSIGDEVL